MYIIDKEIPQLNYQDYLMSQNTDTHIHSTMYLPVAKKYTRIYD